MKIILLLFISLYANAFTTTNYWFPIVPISSYNFEGPSKIEILNKEFVLWKWKNKYVLQDDKCSHRMAPLSEGYIDCNSCNLRCAYHGWEYDYNGGVSNIPQSIYPDKHRNNPALQLQTYETVVKDDILWAYLGSKHSKNYIDDHPRFKNYGNDNNTFMRELPYDYFILLENFFDPAHIPFAHHKLQSTRDKGCTIEVHNTNSTSETLSITFMDKNNNDNRTMSFKYPSSYLLKNEKNSTNGLLKNLHIFTVPVREGHSRILIKTEYNKKHRLYPYISRIPKFINHIFTNKFLDSDTLLLYEQERILRKENNLYNSNNNYKMFTRSDRSIRCYLNWMKKNNNMTLPYFYPQKYTKEIKTRKEILNRFEQHTKTCIHCNSVLNIINKIQYIPILIAGYSYIYTCNILYIIFGSILTFVMTKIKTKLIFEDYIHNNI